MNNAYLTTQDEQFQEWITLRQLLLRAYCQLSRCMSTPTAKPSQKHVEAFCQLLIDYASFGHFCIYERLLDMLNSVGAVDNHIEELLLELKDTTNALLYFNDLHETDSHLVDEARFTRLLSKVGEVIAERLDLEDNLVASANVAPVHFIKKKIPTSAMLYA